MQALIQELLNLPLLPRLFILALPILPNLWCIWQSFRKDFATPMEKVLWICAGVFIPVLGGLLYLLWGRRRVVKSGQVA